MWRAKTLRSKGLWTIVAVVLLWQCAAWLGLSRPHLTGSPIGVVTSGLALLEQQNILPNIGVTTYEFVEGMVVAILVGIPLGLWLGSNRRLRAALDPLLMALYAAPHIAFLPILIVWLGIGTGSKVGVVFLSAVFPIMINTVAGVVKINPLLLEAAAAFGSTRWDRVRRVMVPSILPEVLTGLQLGMGHGLTGVIVAEMYVNLGGIGQLLIVAEQGLDTNRLMAVAIAYTVVGALAIQSVTWYRKKYLPWWEGNRA